jgi:hypothetical protein
MLNIPVRYFEEKVEDFLAKELYSSFELGQIKVICEIVTSYHNYFSSDLIAKVDRINEYWLAPEPITIEDESEVQSEIPEETVEEPKKKLN